MHGLKALNSRFDAISGDVFPSALAENIDCPLLASLALISKINLR